MIVIGILLIFVASYLAVYLSKLEFIKESMSMLPKFIPLEFVLSSGIFILLFIIYFIITKAKYKKVFEDLDNLNSKINDFLSDKNTPIDIDIKTPLLKQTHTLFSTLIHEYEKLLQLQEKKILELEKTLKTEKDIIELEELFVAKVNSVGKVIKANKKFLKFLNYENETKLNMNLKSITDIFDSKLEEDWLNSNIEKYKKVSINGVKFLLAIEKIEQEENYILSLIDITQFEDEKNKLEKKFLYTNKNLKSERAINKTLETSMIRILNYENYATHLGSGILEVFEDAFVEKIKSLGYDDIFKIQNNLFAIYDLKINFEKYRKILEETIIVNVAGEKYIFNPKVVLSSGVNFDQAYQQIIESSYTLISKMKNETKYPLEFIKLVNKAILNNTIILGYQVIENKNNTIIIHPCIKDDYSTTFLPQEVVESFSKEFNLYLVMIKQILINNVNLLKNYQIIINVTSNDLLANTLISDLLSLIKREELFVIFNVEINSKYSLVLPILKQIKSYAQLSFRNIGKGYLSMIDIYSLKVEYLEIDTSIINLIKSNPEWKFLLDSLELLVSAQNTELLAYNSNFKTVYKISNELKFYEN